MSYDWNLEEDTENNLPLAKSRRKVGWMAVVFLVLFLCAGIGVISAGILLRRNNNRAATNQPEDNFAVDGNRVNAGIRPETTITAPTSATEAQLPEISLNRIVYVDDDGRLNTINPDGSQRRVITNEDGRYQFPAWSPDGKWIAAIRRNTRSSSLQLVTDTSFNDTDPTTLFAESGATPIYFYWSPDNTQISLLASSRNGMGLFLTPLNRENRNRLLTTGQPFYWDWAPDGQQILIHTGSGSEDEQLAFISTNNEEIDDLEKTPTPGFFQAPGISHDGNLWAYSELSQTGNNWIVVQDKQGNEQNRTRHAGFASLSWSPVTAQIAYNSPEQNIPSSTGPLRLLDVRSGETKLLSQQEVAAFFWSPDGRKIAYLAENNAGNIAATKPFNRLGKLQPDQPRLSLWVVDAGTGQQTQLAVFQPTQTFRQQFLPFFDQYALSHRLWSPASDAFLMPMRVEDKSQIMLISIAGDEPQIIGNGSIAFWSHQ